MSITTLPNPPNRATYTPSQFADAADALLNALPNFVTEVNATAATVNSQSAAAVASAASASAAPATASTSTTSVGIAVGTKNFTIQTGKNIVVGMFVTVAYDANNYMFGSVISYAGTALSVNIIAVVGGGTYASWSIALSAPVTALNNTISGLLAVGQLNVGGALLGSSVGNQVLYSVLSSSDSTNGDTFEISNTRVSAGTSWTSAGTRLQQKVDSTYQAYIQYNNGGGVGNPGGISFGVGSAASAVAVPEVMRITQAGNLLINQTTDNGFRLDVNGPCKFNGVQHDIQTPNGIGSLRMMKNVSGGSVGGGGTVAGSSLNQCYASTSGVIMVIATAPAGTWKCVVSTGISNNEFGEFVRIA